jgi:hypothetical protein
MAITAAILRHVGKTLEECAMHPAQLAAAAGAFPIHEYCYIPIAREAQEG